MKKLFIKYLKHLVVILFFGLIGYNFLHIIHMFNPIEKIWADFKFSDIYFSDFQEKELDENIYFVDIGVEDNSTIRSKISKFINTVQKKYKPKVIGVDVQFKFDSNVSDDINQDLINSLDDENIVLAYELIKPENSKSKWYKIGSEYNFNYTKISDGYVQNLISAKGLDFGVERFFKPTIKQEKETFKHFSIVIAEKMNIDVNNLLYNNNKVMINYKYVYNEPITIGDESNYYKLKDKIVIIGLFTQNKEGNPLYTEDLHYTPSNKSYFGKSPPDMYGGEVLATIISNLSHNDFIKFNKNFVKWLNIFLSLILYFILIYVLGKSHNIFTASIIIQQFLLVTLIVFASILFIMYFNVYIDLTVFAVIAFFSVEFVGLIEEIIPLFENLTKRVFDRIYKNKKA